MLSIQDAKKTLEQMGMSVEETEKFGLICEPFINFHKFLMKKYNISSEMAENKTKVASKEYLTKNIKGDESQTELFQIVGRGMKEYAILEGYDFDLCEELENNLYELVTMFTTITFKLENDGKKIKRD